jgi:ATP-dependent Clp protease protease subunit
MIEEKQTKTVYIKFFIGVDLNTVKKLTQIVQTKLNEGVSRFVLLISSPGGQVFAGISAYNFLKGIPAEIITHNFGSADSIATILYCAGARRYCVPNARFLLHGIGADINAGLRINEKWLDEQIKSVKADRENISKIISDNTKKTLTEVEKDILDGIVLNAQQAVEYGLVHEIKTELFGKGAEIIDI